MVNLNRPNLLPTEHPGLLKWVDSRQEKAGYGVVIRCLLIFNLCLMDNETCQETRQEIHKSSGPFISADTRYYIGCAKLCVILNLAVTYSL